MALRLILCTMAQESNVVVSSELLDKSKREFLSVILDGSAALVDGAIQE